MLMLISSGLYLLALVVWISYLLLVARPLLLKSLAVSMKLYWPIVATSSFAFESLVVFISLAGFGMLGPTEPHALIKAHAILLVIVAVGFKIQLNWYAKLIAKHDVKESGE